MLLPFSGDCHLYKITDNVISCVKEHSFDVSVAHEAIWCETQLIVDASVLSKIENCF